MKIFVSILLALPFFFSEAHTDKVAKVPMTMHLSGSFTTGTESNQFDGFLRLVTSSNVRTHFQGAALTAGGIEQASNSLERRINYLTSTKNGKSWGEFVIFRGQTYYQFHFPMPSLIPSSGVPINGSVTVYRERYCTQVWEVVCYEELGTSPAVMSVTY